MFGFGESKKVLPLDQNQSLPMYKSQRKKVIAPPNPNQYI